MPASTRFQPLDGLRFIAFIPIFYLHACGGDSFYQLTLTSLDLFFILSGILKSMRACHVYYGDMVRASMLFCCSFLFAWCLMWLRRRKQLPRNPQRV